MELFDAIFKRRDSRHFLEENVPKEVLDKAFKAAYHGPSVGLSQPTKFYLIEKRSIREEIKLLFEKADRKAKENILNKEQKTKYENLKLQAIIDAPVGMLVTTDYSVLNDFTIGVVGNAHALQWTSVCAVQNFWLSLTEDGYSFGWVSIMDYNGLNELLNIPNHEIALGYFCIGKPATDYDGKPMLQNLDWKKVKTEPSITKITEVNTKKPSEVNSFIETDVNVATNNKIFQQKADQIWDSKMMPKASLGKVQQIVSKLCRIQQTLNPSVSQAIALLFVADHGIAQTGLVNKYPQGMTLQLVINTLKHKSAISILCKENNVELKIIDCGLNGVIQHDLQTKNYWNFSISKGTRNFFEESAMTESQLEECFQNGRNIVEKVKLAKPDILIFGEIGIGNTSASSLLLSYFLELPIEKCTGLGAGQSSDSLILKTEILKKVKEKHQPKNGKEALQCFGGFEIATMTGAFVRANELNLPVLVDGFIGGVALLCSEKICEIDTNNILFSHEGKEKAHLLLLKYFKADPLLKLELALGEASGALLAYPVLKNGVALFNELEEF